MPRRAFVADLQELANISSIPNITDVRAGDEDGTLDFEYARAATIRAIIPGESPEAYTTCKMLPRSVQHGYIACYICKSALNQHRC